jgi:hypothetical protein
MKEPNQVCIFRGNTLDRLSNELCILRYQAAVLPDCSHCRVLPVACKCPCAHRVEPGTRIQASETVIHSAGELRGERTFSPNQPQNVEGCPDVAQDDCGNSSQVDKWLMHEHLQAKNRFGHDRHAIEKIRFHPLKSLFLHETKNLRRGGWNPATVSHLVTHFIEHSFTPLRPYRQLQNIRPTNRAEFLSIGSDLKKAKGDSNPSTGYAMKRDLPGFEEEVDFFSTAPHTRPWVLTTPANDGFIRLVIDGMVANGMSHLRRSVNNFEDYFPSEWYLQDAPRLTHSALAGSESRWASRSKVVSYIRNLVDSIKLPVITGNN